ncbi:MAG: hypothetical protein Q4D14_02390, partial [Bacteroidales bacterium]|nr:hypothetical protein [Bacteroidales bacterium]
IKGDVFPEFRVFDLNQQIPVHVASEEKQKEIVAIVDNILNVSDTNLISEAEKKLDIIIYKLYNLNYTDILYIDPETPITHEEYESYKA